MIDKSREEFEEVCDSLPVKITNNEKAVAQYIWTTQQKKIDELKKQIENRQLACDNCSVRFSNEIDALKADNPQVECPGCLGGKHGFTDDGWTICDCCNETGTVPLIKSQAIRIKELEAENAALKRNQENSVKMFKELLLMLDKVAEK